MRTLRAMVCLFVVALFTTNSAFGLEIRVAPQTLVLSSGGGKLTVHTDVPFGRNVPVSLAVNGTPVRVYTFPDSLGNLVAQCTKAAVKQVLGDFDGKRTTATITLTVNGISESQTITVKK